MEITATMENSKLSEAMLYRRAKKQAHNIRAFYINLTCYLIVIPILIYVNLTYSPEHIWFVYSALGWGIGLTFHGLAAFNYSPFLGREWEKNKIQQILDKESSKSNQFTNQ
ncbi:hypothetical protein FNO01nite_13320 [Flavobacterium noncentrifugens]|uniref:2TM domain-containing protein n=1 Tax=Flavobacterium noncentrifugens TaxID=1128970 RepID=A0A1G8VUN7_9FLAO|nr:2TM domain-containing protein [Flavobacterium noncentrifugens]GEP50660.1 hypothetical protein FNO01nite_13320 [Flavobacterium noncentrifugens]SDJ69788.1 2TM domain-containing protein [Flavobacterium noncentrifugens]